jgi:uncharacterized protein (TIGR00255 family)
MIRSMTAFARESQTGAFGELAWELRSVNHRFLEPHIRLPEELRVLEPAVRDRLAARLARGKIDCTLRYTPAVGAVGSLRVNRAYVEQLLAAGETIATLIGRSAEPSAFDLLRWPGVIQEQERDLDAVTDVALTLLDQTLTTLLHTREREGARLAAFLHERCDRLQESVERVRARLPEIMAAVRKRLADRLADLRGELDSGRLEQEMALLAARLDVDEEMDRLTAHVAEVRAVLGRREPVGRRLDFLMQELNREANTLGSKSADVEVTREAVEMKVLIEQLREQIQNLE